MGPFRNIDNSELRVGVMGLGEASYLVLASIGPSCSVSRWALPGCWPGCLVCLCDRGFRSRHAAGVMGGTVADTLVKLGYPVSAWTRSPKQVGVGLSTHGMHGPWGRACWSCEEFKRAESRGRPGPAAPSG